MARKNKEYEMAIKIAGEIEKSFYDSTKLTKKELSDMAKHAAKVAQDASGQSVSIAQKFSQGLKGAEPAFQGLERMSDAAFGAIRAAAATTAAAVSAVTAASVAAGMGFEEQMSAVQAISMASGGDMEKLGEKARELGESTKFSAAEVGQGFEYMAMAGWKTKDMMGGIEGVLNLAAASGEDLGQVSDIVTDAMTAFGMGADQAGRFADVLAVASSNSNTNVSMMGETFKYVAPVAGTFGYTVEDTAVAIGLMANSGIKASQAGTSLRSMLSRMAKPTKEVQAAMDRLGLSLTDGNGNMKSFLQLQKDIREGFKGMSKEQAAETASMLAGQEAMSGLLAVANASSGDFDKLADAVENSAGAAEKMAQIRLDNLKGDLTVLKSAAEGFGIGLYENLAAPAREIVQYGTGIIGNLTEMAAKEFPTVRREVKELAKSVGEFAEPVMALGGWFAKNPGAIAGPIAGIGTAVTAYKAATGLQSLAGALGAMGTAGMAVMGIGAVAAVITGIGVSIKKSAAEAKKANLDRHFGDISLSLKDIQETASFIVRDKSVERMQEAMAAFGELDGISDSIQDAARELDRADWKVSIGMELGEGEREDYQARIQEYAESMQEYARQEQYAITMSVKMLLGDRLESSNMPAVLDRFYADRQQELADLGRELNETVTEAFNDGLLDPDEVEVISNLRQKMAHIKQTLAQGDFEAGLDLLELKYGGKLDADSAMNLMQEIQELTEQELEGYGESYREAMAGYRAALAEGEITPEEFEYESGLLKSGYLEHKANQQAKALEFFNGQVWGGYGDELGGLVQKMQEETDAHLQEMLGRVARGETPNIQMDWLPEDIIGEISVDRDMRDALADLYGQARPAMEQMQEIAQQFRDGGKAVPEAVRKGILDAAQIGALAGDMDAMWVVVSAAAESEECRDAIQAVADAGGYIPEGLANAIADGQDEIDNAIKQSFTYSQRTFDRVYGQNSLKIPVNFAAKAPYSDKYLGGLAAGEGHAQGGIFDRPHIAWFAEKGPEAAIPIDGSSNAIDLWLKTGELLGMDGVSGGSTPVTGKLEQAVQEYSAGTTIQVTYSPTTQVYGNSVSGEEIENLFMSDQERFAQMMDQYVKDNGRIVFH